MFSKILISLFAMSCILAGCSTGPQEIAKADIQQATDNAANTKSLFDSVEGDFDKLSAVDKKKLTERYKSEAVAKKLFETMKHPPLGGAVNSPQGK